MGLFRWLAFALLLTVVPTVTIAASTPGDLAEAASNGDLDRVKNLLAEGVPVDERGKMNATPLMRAAEQQHVDVMKALLTAGADPKATRDGGVAVLHHAAASGSVEAVSLLLAAKADIDVAMTDGRTPLHTALAYKKWDVARALLAAGAKLMATPTGERALMLALDDSYLKQSLGEDLPYLDIGLAKTLVQSGARLDLKDARGYTALHFAAHARQPEMVAFLLQNGLKADEPATAGDTPLDLAAEPATLETLANGFAAVSVMLRALNKNSKLGGDLDDPRIVKKRLFAAGFPSPDAGKLAPRIADIQARRKRTLELLLAAGANPNTANKAGQTPLDNVAYQGDAASVEVLLAAKADPNVVKAKGYSPLMRAAQEANAATVAMLLAHGAQVDLRNEAGETALMRAAIAGGDRDTVAALLAAHPDVNARNSDGQTALIYAVGGRKDFLYDGADNNPDIEPVVSLLLAAGADPRIADNGGNTAISLANDNGKYRAARALLSNAAPR